MNYKEHWNKAYSRVDESQLGWYEIDVSPTIQLIKKAGIGPGSRLLTVGAGSTTLIDTLLEHGYDNSAQVQVKGAVIIPPVYIAPDAVFERAVVGPYVNVCSGAVIRDVIVRNSLVGPQATIEDIYLEGSLIGEKAQVKGRPTRLNIGNAATAGIEYTVDESFSY